MPRTALPPTPASSTDIKGQDGTKHLAALHMSFELPPPAFTPEGDAQQQRTPTDEIMFPKKAYPLQPSETVKSRRRSSAVQPPKEQFALPPPPTRSRKIIQMKPRAQKDTTPATAKNSTASKATVAGSPVPDAGTVATPPAATAGTKRKQPSTTSAAGRKIARKTAHSLIERRRRSKMNEEFAVLKGMIPACSGEMHKLAILQASIEYVRYLEDCVAKLKAQRDTDAHDDDIDDDMRPSPTNEPFRHESHFQAYTGALSPDIEMTGSEATPSPTFTASNGRSQQQSISPALLPQDSQSRHDSHSSGSTDPRHYSYSASASTSPAFGPRAGYQPAGSALTSPALAPQRDVDQEATAALLMLNQSDRRGTAGRGMSVRDLLTS